MVSVLAENADIKNFFEKKMCKDVVNIIDDFAKPYLFEVGDEIEVNFTWTSLFGNVVNECNSYEIAEIYRNKYCSEVYIYEDKGDDISLIYDEDEDGEQPKRLFINKNSCGDEYISFAELETDDIKLTDYIFEAKNYNNICLRCGVRQSKRDTTDHDCFYSWDCVLGSLWKLQNKIK